MPWFEVLHWKSDTEADKLAMQTMPKFEPGELDRVEPEFQMRACRSTDPEFPECIVFRYLDGSMPTKPTVAYEQATYPTWKGKHAKRRSALGKYGILEKGVSIIPGCGNIFCINQKHLTIKLRPDAF